MRRCSSQVPSSRLSWLQSAGRIGWLDRSYPKPIEPSPNLIPDAALAALAIEYGVTLISTDADFARFRELRWENPLG